MDKGKALDIFMYALFLLGIFCIIVDIMLGEITLIDNTILWAIVIIIALVSTPIFYNKLVEIEMDPRNDSIYEELSKGKDARTKAVYGMSMLARQYSAPMIILQIIWHLCTSSSICLCLFLWTNYMFAGDTEYVRCDVAEKHKKHSIVEFEGHQFDLYHDRESVTSFDDHCNLVVHKGLWGYYVLEEELVHIEK